MRKIVSTDDGYSLFLEKKNDNIKCVAYETEKHMSGQEIADILEITRSAVSQSLKRSIRRIFLKLKKNNNISSIEIACAMAKVFNVKTDSQYVNFFRLFSDDIKGEIYAEACKSGYCKN